MTVEQHEDGTFHVILEGDDAEKCAPQYVEALPRYLEAFNIVFAAAKARSDFEFICSLLRFRGVMPSSWDPYETTLRAIDSILKLHDRITDFEAARHLLLWTYGHIVEASEPYELVANLLGISRGERWLISRFPDHPGRNGRPGRPQTPGEKISKLSSAAGAAGLPDVVVPLREVWDRDLRNAIFHADYSLNGGDVRLRHPARVYTHAEIMLLVNRAIAYHAALASLDRMYTASYTEPVEIPVPGEGFDPECRAIVMVREGHGVVGLKDSWTPKQIASGKIPFLIGRFLPEESRMLDMDPARAFFPARPAETARARREPSTGPGD